MTRSRAAMGFTLAELLVALFIFGLLSAAGVALLSFAVDSRGRTDARLDRAAGLGRLRALLVADLAQAAPRLWRDETGARHPAFAADAISLGLVRRGWSNPAGAARSSLQRVEYRLIGQRLERRIWPLVDGAAPATPAVLLADVTALRLRFRVAGEWRDRWDAVAADALPQAVEITLSTPQLPDLRQVFLVGPGARA